MTDQAQRLPARPSLEQLRKQAKELHRELGSGTLADAQFALARRYGFESWPKLKRHVENVQPPADFHEPTWGRRTWEFLTAVYEGRVEQVREMLTADASLVEAQYAYLRPLHYAVRGGRPEMVRLLIEAGANPVAAGWSGRPLGDDSPLARARDRGNAEIIRLLEAAAASRPWSEGKEPDEAPDDERGKLEREMSGYGHRGDKKGAVAMLERHPDLAYAGLYEAVHQGHTKLARLLLERGADPTKPWRWACWFTPLMHSLRYRFPNFEMAEMLLARGVTPDDRNGMGMATLHILASLGTEKATAWLLDRSADIHARDLQFDSTPLAWAARVGREDMVKFLLARGAHAVHADDELWATPAAWARRRGHTRIVALLDGWQKRP